MKTEILFISPEMAESYLASNSENRAVSYRRVLTLTAEMNAGKWQLNGEPIIISTKGRLLDGQHRLFAIIEHGKPVQMLVISDIPEEAFKTIDTGAARSAGDIVGMQGIANAKMVAAGAALIWRLYHGTGVSEVCPPPFTLEVIKRYRSLLKWSPFVNHNKAGGHGILPPASFLAALVYLEEIANKPAAAERFFEKMVKGTELAEGSPHLALRNRIMRFRASGAPITGATVWHAIARTLTAIEAGETLTRVSIQPPGGTIVRPALFEEHVSALPQSKKLDDLRPIDSRRLSSSVREKFTERVKELRAMAEDKRASPPSAA